MKSINVITTTVAILLLLCLSALYASDTTEKDSGKVYEWPMIACDAGWTGFSPDPLVKPPFRLKWATQGPIRCSNLIVADGMVLYRGELCLDAETGAVISKGRRGKNSPAYYKGRLYLGPGGINTTDARTGKRLWSKRGFVSPGGHRGGLVVSDGAVYCGKVKEHGGKKFYFACALDAENGNEIWATPLVAVVKEKRSPYELRSGGMAGITAHGDRVFASTFTPMMAFALDRKTGKEIWRQEGVTARFALGTDGKTVWAAAAEHGVAALDAETGKKLWHWGGTDIGAHKGHYLHTGTADYPPVAAYGMLFVSNYGRQYMALDAATGKQLWVAGDKGGHGWAGSCGQPSAAGGYIYTNGTVGKDYQGKKYRWVVSATDHKTGKAVWTHPLCGQCCARVSIAYGRLYVPHLGEVSCFEPVGPDYRNDPQPPPTEPAAPPAALAVPFNGKPGTPEAGGKPEGGKDWPMYGGCPERCGLDIEIGLPIKEAWKFNSGGKVKSSPVISGGMVFAGNDSGKLFALELAAGKQKWSTEITPHQESKDQVKWIRSAPAVSNGIVVCGADDGVMRAFDAKTGELKWQFRTSGRIRSSPAIVGDRVVFGSWDGRCYCVRLSDGREFWRHPMGDPGVRVYAPTAIAKGRVYVGVREDRQIHALDLGTGKPLAGYTQASGYATKLGLVEGIAVYRGLVITCKSKGGGQPIDASTGKSLSRYFGLSASAVPSLPAFAGDRIYYTTYRRGASLAETLSPSKTRSRKKRRRALFKNPGLNAPLISGNLMVMATIAGTLEVYRLPGEKSEEPAEPVWEWKSPSGAEIHTAPAAADDCIVIGSDDGHVYAFRYTKED